MVSFDVKSLFTSVHLDQTINIILTKNLNFEKLKERTAVIVYGKGSFDF